jgi:hypothetical protein
MAQDKRSTYAAQIKKDVGTGPYLARIISHLDPSFMGGLEVMLLRDTGNVPGEETQTYPVKCASPFFGYTGFEFMGQNTATASPQGGQKASTQEAYNDTQKSYGMWMVPPDVGVTVLVIFVDGSPDKGYWIGCIPPNFANNMVPAIGGSTNVDYSDEDKKKLDTKQPLPVAEINRRLNKTDNQTDPKNIKKPLHPIAERFLEQGLLEDDVRGTTTTSARREIPSMVFGISTPGPRDKRPNAKKAVIGTKAHQQNSFVSRLGGTQFVMDDGDERFQRKTPAGEGPVEYADVLAGEKGDPTLPYNEYFRVRTRTGHQILMHNTEDLIYIGNSKGTTWIELTSNGKIDIFAEDSISIHTKNDLNIRADRDINLEAGRNINLKTGARPETGDGRLQMDVTKDWNVTVGNDGFITTTGNFDINTTLANKFTAGTSTDLNSGTFNKFTAGSTTDILSGGVHTETASIIHMNGPTASEAEKAKIKEPLITHPNVNIDPAKGWNNRYVAEAIESIMKRVPMHEPWPLHENFAPQSLTPDDTDREV